MYLVYSVNGYKIISKIKLPSMVGNANGNDAINTIWQEHYSNIFNSVKGSSCEDIHAAMCMEHIVFDRDMIVSGSGWPNQ